MSWVVIDCLDGILSRVASLKFGEDSLLRRDSQDSFVIWVVLLMLTLIVWLFRSVTTAVEYADSEDSEDDDDKSSFE